MLAPTLRRNRATRAFISFSNACCTASPGDLTGVMLGVSGLWRVMFIDFVNIDDLPRCGAFQRLLFDDCKQAFEDDGFQQFFANISLLPVRCRRIGHGERHIQNYVTSVFLPPAAFYTPVGRISRMFFFSWISPASNVPTF